MDSKKKKKRKKRKKKLNYRIHRNGERGIKKKKFVCLPNKLNTRRERKAIFP